MGYDEGMNTIANAETLTLISSDHVTRIDDDLSAVYFAETKVMKVYDRDSMMVLAQYIRIMDADHAARVLAEVFPA